MALSRKQEKICVEMTEGNLSKCVLNDSTDKNSCIPLYIKEGAHLEGEGTSNLRQ
jgi:hypothetical protein